MTGIQQKTVVVGVDGTEGSAGALRYAAVEAARLGATLRLVHVSPTYTPLAPMMPYLPDDLAEAGRGILREAEGAVAVAHSGPVETRLLAGGRVAELVGAGDGADLLVLGHESRHGVDRMLLGATTAAVAAHATVPLVGVPATWQPGTGTGIVMAGLKSHHHATELLEVAFAVAAARRAVLRLVHVWSLPDPYADRIEQRTHDGDWVAASRMQVDRLLEPWRELYPGVAVEIVPIHDAPGPALLAQAESVDLVLLVRHAAGLVPGHHLGAVGRFVLAHATVPVEVVPERAAGSGAPGPVAAAETAGSAAR